MSGTAGPGSKERSFVWKHFEKVEKEDKATCKYCDKDFSYKGGSTSNLNRHLQSLHSEKLEGAKVKKTNTSVLDMLTQKTPSSATKNRLDTALVTWLVEEGIAFHTVRSDGFKKMLTIFLQQGSNGQVSYAPPRERRLLGLARKMVNEQRSLIQKWISRGCQTATISVDGWTSTANVSYWAVVLHFMDTIHFRPVNLTLAIQKKDDQNATELAKVTREILSSWGLWKTKEERFLCHVVSDTASVNPAAVRELDGENGHLWIPCACHVLQLVVNESLKIVKSLLQRHRNVVRFFKKSAKEKGRFLQLQQDSGKKPKTLIRGCETRWSGTHDMLARNLELKDEICEVIGTRKIEEACPDSEKAAKEWCRQLTEPEWEISEQLLKILTPINVATKEFQSNTSPTLSLVLPYVETIRRQCKKNREDESLSPIIRQVANLIFLAIGKRFSLQLKNPIYAIATLVDPLTKRFFKTYVPAEVRDEVEKFVMLRIKNSQTEAQPVVSNAAPKLHSLLSCEETPLSSFFSFESYLSEPVLNPDQVPSFLLKQPQALRELYISICGIPAASSDVERLFSTSGIINSKLRCSLTSRNLEDRCLLKRNSMSLNAFNEHLYPDSTPKLADWVSALPGPLSYNFFPDEAADAKRNNKEADDNDNEWDSSTTEGVQSESEGEEEWIGLNEIQSGEWWEQSNATKNFAKGVKGLGDTNRKRKRDDDENLTAPAKKRRIEPLVRPPTLGSRVMVYYRVCTCEKSEKSEKVEKEKCDCQAEWFPGTVLEELEPNIDKDRVFYIDFDCGDDDKVEWKCNSLNEDWAKCVE